MPELVSTKIIEMFSSLQDFSPSQSSYSIDEGAAVKKYDYGILELRS